MTHPALLAKYNELKRALDGESYERYTEIKGKFIEEMIARTQNGGELP